MTNHLDARQTASRQTAEATVRQTRTSRHTGGRWVAALTAGALLAALLGPVTAASAHPSTVGTVPGTAQVVSGDTPTAAYIRAIYRDLLGRGVDSSGLHTWTRALTSGTPRSAVADSITYSAEYRRALIQGSYQEFLGRGADQTGLNTWLKAMERGMTIQQMESGFLASPEYFGRAGSTYQGWVSQLYRHVLGRNASPHEIAGWVKALNRGASRSDVARGFLLSSERLTNVINGHYRDLLGRTIDDSGRASWVRAIQNGARLETVIAGIIASNEYFSRNAKTSPASTAPKAGPTPPPQSSLPPSSPPTDTSPAPAPQPGTNPPPPTAPAPTQPRDDASKGVGVPSGTPLTVYPGSMTITTPGTVVDGMDIRGFVRVRAKDVVIRNSIIRGPSSPLTGPMALVQSDAGPDTNLLIEDSEIFAAAPSRFVDGIVGMGFTLRRVDIHTVIDQVKIIGDNVTVDSSHLHGNLFYPADGKHIESHDDNVQIAVGNNVQVINSTLSGTTNAAVMITQDRGSVRNFVFRNNVADNGACTINVAEKAYGPPPGLTIVDNVFGTGQRHPRCAILLSNSTKEVATVTGNTFTDGSPTPVSRGA